MNWIVVSDFFTRTWYIWTALVLLIGVWFYHKKVDAYTKYQLKKTFSKGRLIFVLMIVGWVIWSKVGQYSEVSDANRWMPVIILIFFTAINYMGKLRYETQQIITPNFHGSYSKNPYYVNGFYIFSIDSFNAGGIAWDYAKRILIIREETLELFMRGAISIAEVSKTSKYALDDDVREFIECNTFLKGASEEVYYGWFDSIEKVDWDFKQLLKLNKDRVDGKTTIYSLLKKELGVDNPSVKTLFWMYRNQCKATGKQTEVLDSAVVSIEKGVEHHKRVKDAYVDSSDQKSNYSGSEEDY